jgi:hypothetical protein
MGLVGALSMTVTGTNETEAAGAGEGATVVSSRLPAGGGAEN